MRGSQRRARTPRRPTFGLWIAAAVLIGGIVAVAALVGGQPSGPRVGDHWHAPFKVVICGERTPPLPPAEGDIHTHGDDIIHIHPQRPETAGRNATLAAFLATTPLRVTPTSLALMGKPYQNGDRCPNGRAGTVSVIINGTPRAGFLSYVPRDGDQLEFRFGP